VRPLQGATRAEVTLGRAAGRLEVSALQSQTNLVEGTLQLRDGEKRWWITASAAGRRTCASATREHVGPMLGDAGRSTWAIKLNDDIPMTLEVSLAAGRASWT